MGFETSARQVPRLVVLDSAASTNTELGTLANREDLGDYTTVVTLDQRAGRGRLERSWSSPAGTALAISVLIRPVDAVGRALLPDQLGWVSIAAGVAMTETVTELVPRASVTLKWPNDVLVGDRKVSGVLCELRPDALIVGAGLNLTMTEEQLPVPTATSLTLEGADSADLADRALASYLTRLRSHTAALLVAGGNADGSGLRERARELCGTLGGPVRVELPGGDELSGTAVDLDSAGRLVVAPRDGRPPVAVAAGDVTHAWHG